VFEPLSRAATELSEGDKWSGDSPCCHAVLKSRNMRGLVVLLKCGDSLSVIALYFW
jgi:hypothetical protein